MNQWHDEFYDYDDEWGEELDEESEEECEDDGFEADLTPPIDEESDEDANFNNSGNADDPTYDESPDPWTEDDHRKNARRGSEHASNRGLREAEQNAGDFYTHAHLAPEDSHGISVPQLTAFDTDDVEKTFRWPEDTEERHVRKMEGIARKYERNEDLDDESQAWEDLTDYEDDILSKAEERLGEFFDEDREEEHFRRLRDDTAYIGSADREYYVLHRELLHKLEMYEDRISKCPDDKDLYLPYVHGALEAIDNARHLYAKNRDRQEDLKEMLDSGELSDMQYQDQSIALEARLQRQLTGNEYKAISGGNAMFEDVGSIMDDYNNLLDDIYADNPNTLQRTREIISGLPLEVAEKLLQTAFDDGLLNKGQMNHLMTMASRPES